LEDIENGIARMPEAIRTTGKCRSAIYAELKVGKFPRKIRLGRRAIGFSRRQLQAYIRSMIAGIEYKPE
jgi:predicted DNA-binding transcriptional regulator AlpA